MANAEFLKLLLSTGYVSRKYGASDLAGNEGMGPTNNAGDFQPLLVNGAQFTVRCRIAQQSTRARSGVKEGNKDTIGATLTAFMDITPAVQERDRLMVDGLLYDLADLNIPQDSNGYHHYEFQARRVT